MKNRLTREDWMLAGFRALVRYGSSGLKAEAIARDLKSTKGSFYWHFKDVADFEMAMLSYWQLRATENVMTLVVQKSTSARQDLRRLVKIVSDFRDEAYGGLSAESAIWHWASTNARVEAVRREVDKMRMHFLTSLFERAGFSSERALLHAELLYAAVIGLEYLESQNLAVAREGLLALLEILLTSD